MILPQDLEELRAGTLGSLLTFTKFFYPLRTGREFKLSQPISQESHFITVSRALTKVFRMECDSLLINMPPGFGKSVMCEHFVAWCMAQYPDSNFVYISYAKDEAVKHTSVIRDIMSLPQYQMLYNVHLKDTSNAKDDFQTTMGGTIAAFGANGPVTGKDAGLPWLDRFSGAVIIDDFYKADEVHSATIRESRKINYLQTISQRPRSRNVAMLYVGHRLHEDDQPANLLLGVDGRDWNTHKVVIKSEENGLARYPELYPMEFLRKKRELDPYTYWSQFQQEPISAGLSLYKADDFVIVDEVPNILATFITADTAETDKTYNDATVFSFWGAHKIFIKGIDTGMYGLHWLDCWELRIEAKDLEANFLQFYAECMRYPIKPKTIVIENKSSGVTLSSTLSQFKGMQVIRIKPEPGKSKIARFIDMQPFINSKCISFNRYAKHVKMCIDHCTKITANQSHAHDDIADTLYYAVKLALIDKTIVNCYEKNPELEAFSKQMATSNRHIRNLWEQAYGSSTRL